MRSDAVVWLLLGACTGPGPVMLVDQQLWQEVSAEEDPFDDRPQAVLCPSSAWGTELDLARTDPDGETALVLELDTGLCTYLLAEQGSVVDVVAGEEIHVEVTHGPLDAPMPAEGHAVVTVGTHTLLDYRVAIPAPVGGMKGSFVAPADIPAGTQVQVHVHNHGDNTWNLRTILVGTLEDGT